MDCSLRQWLTIYSLLMYCIDTGKLIIHKLRGEVSLEEQGTIDFVFHYCQPSQNQPKSQILFHKNCSPRNLSIMTFYIHSTYYTEGSHNSHKIIFFGPIVGLVITRICYVSSRKWIMKLFILIHRIDFCDPSMLLHFIVSTAYIVCLVYSLREAIYVN